ncbi:hypothetical protein FHX82_005625 [Amycolatopsis bartoniae]|uniref:ATP-grasp domain-containing protein n=1 Tax=Amycolatopsis bartoniae TaxID=941986 RepID=A0A8H9IYA5_9PSEU|nr:hypothetical protein [Amycolatopsis bartoniae]MBB2938547.1 hypothetical protein [Amycolatopsis bartoniae]TVT10313.1 hypothetical protein FNH07_05305 [Amycolatopsis bartoniae]GHF70232.1 hypothetical protein GCM10017566_49980 [Amycolatopsis bartoniae]
MPPGAVFLISRTTDRADDLVALELHRRAVPFRRFNVDLFPRQASVVFDPVAGTLALDGEDASALLRGEARVWCRGLRFPRQAGNDADRYVLDESADLLTGVLACAPPVKWMNHPDAVTAASGKARQLRLAARLGFAVPATVLTNDLRAVRDHCRAHPDSVAKPVTGRRFTVGEHAVSVYTAALTAPDAGAPAMTTPFCAQERLTGEDVRVTVIGRRCHAVAITTRSDAVDWRLARDDDVGYRKAELPPDVRNRVLDLVAAFGLRYAAVDLFRAGDRYHFLELNPGGQWAWLEHACGLPLTRLIADELLSEESHHDPVRAEPAAPARGARAAPGPHDQPAAPVRAV